MEDSPTQPLFTCLSCLIAFHTGEEQREHYRSDHHRYNMKRRVASLPPVSVQIFNQKVLDKRLETAVTTSDRGATCETCNKSYSTENAYRSHLQSKKHRENETKASFKTKANPEVPTTAETSNESASEVPSAPEASASAPAPSPPTTKSGREVEVKKAHGEDGDDGDEEQTLEGRLALARTRIGLTSCIFCTAPKFPSLEANLQHMSFVHGLFIPDAEYLVDLPGLITYLGEKVAVGNVCLYCNSKGREFRSIESVREHMNVKGHCKVAYDKREDQLELSDFYDFSSSYPVAYLKSRGKGLRRRTTTGDTESSTTSAQQSTPGDDDDSDQWEDEDDEDVTVQDDESVYDEEEELPENELKYGDSPFELVLPSGARVGHRAMARYYKQSFHSPLTASYSEAKTGAALVRKLIADKNPALIPIKAGFGAFGTGTMTFKAREGGRARQAGQHIREFRDQRRREEFRTRVGIKANNHKYYRDPLLQ
ncbi:C2H2 type zinc-finger-domain-containing protein [Cantharellus anzutake]|uniref:C2H2 type zinc-finger-domain-containing protein n=1 Tax=Cantharellus anzutake TaxID=1750568 RepID=UPI00190355C6|nr:C2H2 type zinc-finger-domain-containing protein [Cantharellus anzutake]KAF8325203.1 C2H2 type zinc-finger-domain-containing protein [Cantharellus anzutake]